MNNKLQSYAREELKEGLSKLPDGSKNLSKCIVMILI